MDLKSAIAWLTPFDTETNLTQDHVDAVKTLVSFYFSIVEAKGMPQEKPYPLGHDIGFNECSACSEVRGYNQGRADMLAYHTNGGSRSGGVRRGTLRI